MTETLNQKRERLQAELSAAAIAEANAKVNMLKTRKAAEKAERLWDRATKAYWAANETALAAYAEEAA